MQYRLDKHGNRLSALGFGCMRFKRRLGAIDMEETEKQILAAVEGGVNIFDTAYIYPGSESALGEILERNGLRDRVNISTKLPHYLIRSREGLEKIFTEELRRLRTDYVDYYFMHMLTSVTAWERMKGLGILEWLAEKKASGAIRQVGFSYHGNTDEFCRLIDAHDWDFCMIQYNYLDEHSQAGQRGLRYAHGKGIPVWIMEPLRGGKLVSRLQEEARRVFAEHPVQHTPAQWAFRWLWDQPEVTCVLSGMNGLEMVKDNIRTAGEARVGELTTDDRAMLAKVVEAINGKMRVGCTGCGYCTPCPKGVDIPGVFAACNRGAAEGKFWGKVDYIVCTAMRKGATAASACVGCGKCEQHCPQGIAIREELRTAADDYEGAAFRAVRWVVTKLKLFG